MNDEKTLLDAGGVTITTNRFIVGGESYAVRNLTSVKAERVGSFVWTGAAALIAAFALVSAFTGNVQASGGAVAIGLMFVALAIGLYVRAKTLRIRIGTTAGEKVALSTRDSAFAQKIVGAISQAMASH